MRSMRTLRVCLCLLSFAAAAPASGRAADACASPQYYQRVIDGFVARKPVEGSEIRKEVYAQEKAKAGGAFENLGERLRTTLELDYVHMVDFAKSLDGDIPAIVRLAKEIGLLERTMTEEQSHAWIASIGWPRAAMLAQGRFQSELASREGSLSPAERASAQAVYSRLDPLICRRMGG